jgi:hypothetical protein
MGLAALGRMLKKPSNVVLASLKASTYKKRTPRLIAPCGLVGGHFEHPDWSTRYVNRQRFHRHS